MCVYCNNILAVYALIVSLAGSWRGGLRHRCYGKNVNQICVLLIGIGATVISFRNIIAVFPIIFIRYVNLFQSISIFFYLIMVYAYKDRMALIKSESV